MPVRSMTCSQLGGPCNVRVYATTADGVIKAQYHHLKEAVLHQDAAHQDALMVMKRRWLHPISGMSWYCAIKRRFPDMPPY